MERMERMERVERVERVVVRVVIRVVVYRTKSHICMKSPAASLLLQGGDLSIVGTLHFTYSETPIRKKRTIHK